MTNEYKQSDISRTALQQQLSNSQRELKKLQARHTALFELNKLSNECSQINTFYSQVHHIIGTLIEAKNFYIVLYDQTMETLEFVYHVDEKDKTPEGIIAYSELDGSMTHYVIETGAPLLAHPDKAMELQRNDEIRHIGTVGTDWLGVPLISDGIVIGVMALQSYDESIRYKDEDLELLVFTAQHIVSALTRLQDHERLRNAVNARTQELMQQIRDREKSELLQESLYRISELTNDVTKDINEFYRNVHNIIGQLLNAENFYIARHVTKRNLLEFVYYLDNNAEDLIEEFKPRTFANGLTEYVIKKGETVLLNRDAMWALYQAGETVQPQAETQSWLGVPLRSDGVVIGAMVVQSYTDANVYRQQDAELLNFVSHHVSTAITRREAIGRERRYQERLEKQVKKRTAALEDEIKQRKKAEKELQHAASHDGLTGLANRSVFIDMLNRAIASRRRKHIKQFAILFLDLDRFKVVNDSLGHQAGDALLKIVAKELKNAVRAMDTVARLGGDEFVILVEELDSSDEVIDIAERITKLLTSPFSVQNQPIFIGTSIGILFSDDHYANANEMLRDADTAMYHAKYNGKGRYEIFDASMYHSLQNALSLETDLREAIQLQEFEPFFQPIVNLANYRVVGFEALARWQSHKRGFVYPNEFIPLAEETNLVMDIDLQIFEKACTQLKKWQQLLGRKDLYVSCNLFCNHFFNNSLANDLAHIIAKVGIAPENVRVEITERALLEHADVVLNNLQALKKLGVQILLDDFGTGYSSLSYLHRYPLDVLKIDRSFITNVHEHANNRAIIKTIIDLATNLSMATVGEGIENSADATLLQQMDCHYGQGYYFAKPMNATDAQLFLQENKQLA